MSLMSPERSTGLSLREAAGIWSATCWSNRAIKLKAAGADFFLLACNTVHTAADRIQSAVDLPFLHIVDPTAREVQQRGVTYIGLLGSRYTMPGSYFVDRLREHYRMNVLVAEGEHQENVHGALYGELAKSNFRRCIYDAQRQPENLSLSGRAPMPQKAARPPATGLCRPHLGIPIMATSWSGEDVEHLPWSRAAHHAILSDPRWQPRRFATCADTSAARQDLGPNRGRRSRF
jgi:Asp/Glu/Hydantoin racemase